jgi:hypothetical protein
MKNQTLALIGAFFFLILLTASLYLGINSYITNKNTPTQDSSFKSYLELIETQNEFLIKKIDSIELSKTEKINTYYKTKLIYDTIRTTIDTMPPLDATKLLLSKSRQLTNKGIE